MIELLMIWRNLDINDLLFAMMQIALVYWLLYSLYLWYAKLYLIRKLKNVKTRINTLFIEASGNILRHRAIVKQRLQKLFNRKKPSNSKTQHIIIASISGSAHLSGNIQLQVIRGEGSWAHFTLAWTVLTVLYMETSTSYLQIEAPELLVAIILFDFAIITYLCFYSAWLRNKIIGIINHRTKTPD